jgi:predicted HTH domain antitoxin
MIEKKTISIDVPKEIIHILKVRKRELPRVLREIIAVNLYKDGLISIGKASEIVGVSKWEMFDILAAKRIAIQYYPEDLEEDIETLEKKWCMDKRRDHRRSKAVEEFALIFVEHYQSLSEKYLTEAGELLKVGDLVQASEKFWSAYALAGKAIAAKRGLKREQHGSLWNFQAVPQLPNNQ